MTLLPTLLQSAQILIVDDQEANVRLLERILEAAGYTHLTSITDARTVLTRLTEIAPDLILLDLRMPYLNGFQILQHLPPLLPPGTYLPVLVLTADITTEAKRQALALGAKDFLTKPFDSTEVLLRIHNLLETRLLHQQLQNQNAQLEERVRVRTWELEEVQREMLERLAVAAEYRDDETGQHTRRVAQLASRLAQAIALPAEQVTVIQRTAPLHDVGKIGIPDAILLKPGPLTPPERVIMQAHTIIGAQILTGGHSTLTRQAEEIARTHHERWDGLGYPQGLAGDAIPIAGRIVAVADTWDALTHDRPYKRAWTPEAARDEVVRQRGQQFDPQIVDAFLALPDVS